VVFSVFSDDAKIQPISENPGKKFPGKSDFGENFRKSPKIRKNSGNSEKSAKTSILENSTSFAERVLKRTFLGAKIDKKK
jgi:hypothetical protein